MSSSDFILQHASEEKYEVSGPTHQGRGEGGVGGCGGLEVECCDGSISNSWLSNQLLSYPTSAIGDYMLRAREFDISLQ